MLASGLPKRTRAAALALSRQATVKPTAGIASPEFGGYVRKVREARAESDAAFTLRAVAGSVGIQPSYLSLVERGLQPPPSEDTIRRLAIVLEEDADVLLAMAGKVSSDLRSIICRRPQVFAQLIRQLRSAPDHAVLSLVREVRDGEW